MLMRQIGERSRLELQAVEPGLRQSVRRSLQRDPSDPLPLHRAEMPVESHRIRRGMVKLRCVRSFNPGRSAIRRGTSERFPQLTAHCRDRRFSVGSRDRHDCFRRAAEPVGSRNRECRPRPCPHDHLQTADVIVRGGDPRSVRIGEKRRRSVFDRVICVERAMRSGSGKGREQAARVYAAAVFRQTGYRRRRIRSVGQSEV